MGDTRGADGRSGDSFFQGKNRYFKIMILTTRKDKICNTVGSAPGGPLHMHSSSSFLSLSSQELSDITIYEP